MPAMARHTRLSIALYSIACSWLILGVCAIGACSRADEGAPPVTPDSAEWSLFESDWFSIRYPGDFVVRPSLPSGDGAFDSVFFDSPDGDASFYVLSPQWGRKALDIQLRPDREREVSVEEIETERGTRTVRTVAAIDGESMRIVEENSEDDGAVYWVTAFEYRGDAARQRYARAYEDFKDSLEQFAD